MTRACDARLIAPESPESLFLTACRHLDEISAAAENQRRHSREASTPPASSPLRLSIWCSQRTPTRHTPAWSSVIPSETEFSPVHPHPVYPGIVRRPAAVQSPQQRPPATHSMVTGSEGRSAALRSAVGTYQSSHFVPLPRSEAPSHLHPGHRKRTTTITPAFE